MVLSHLYGESMTVDDSVVINSDEEESNHPCVTDPDQIPFNHMALGEWVKNSEMMSFKK